MLKLAMGSALLVTATQVVAVSLGATQGSVIIGRPLDLLVQTSITASEAASGLCLDAELLYGDTRVPATAITTAIQQIGEDGRGALRIRSTEPVNEPFVTLILRAGCSTSFRRSYTLLADLEPRAPAALPPSTVQLTPASRPAGPAVSIPAPRSSGSAVAVSPAAATAKAPVPDSQPPETPIRLSEPAPRPAAVTRMLSKTRPLPTVVPSESDAQADRQVSGPVEQPAVTVPAGPRLQLDPVDLTVRSGVPSTTEPPAETSQSGPVSLAEPGQDESAQAQTVTPDSDRQQQALQQEVEALRAEQERMRLALETLNNQLREAQSSQRTFPWLYGVSGLAILLLGGYWFALRSRRRTETPSADKNATPWWESSLPDTATSSDEARSASSESEAIAQPMPAAAAAAPSGARSNWASESVEGMEVAEGRESMFQEVPVAPLDVERLQDLWQHVEFCESIGQYRDAMSSLKAFVTDSPRASEAPYLLWLKIAGQHGSDADRTAASSFYESHFQRLAPALTAIDSPQGLDDDASCAQSLVREWPDEAARAMLATSLSSQPGDVKGVLSVRTLRAFDDLIVLLGMLDNLPTVDHASDQPRAVDHRAKLEELDTVYPPWESAPDIPAVKKPAPGAMLDLDLSSMSTSPEGKPDEAPKKALEALDFDLFQLEPKTEKPATEGPAAEGPEGDDTKGRSKP